MPIHDTNSKSEPVQKAVHHSGYVPPKSDLIDKRPEGIVQRQIQSLANLSLVHKYTTPPNPGIGESVVQRASFFIGRERYKTEDLSFERLSELVNQIIASEVEDDIQSVKSALERESRKLNKKSQVTAEEVDGLLALFTAPARPMTPTGNEGKVPVKSSAKSEQRKEKRRQKKAAQKAQMTLVQDPSEIDFGHVVRHNKGPEQAIIRSEGRPQAGGFSDLNAVCNAVRREAFLFIQSRQQAYLRGEMDETGNECISAVTVGEDVAFVYKGRNLLPGPYRIKMAVSKASLERSSLITMYPIAEKKSAQAIVPVPRAHPGVSLEDSFREFRQKVHGEED